MAECEDDWADAPCLRPCSQAIRDGGWPYFYRTCDRCGWHLDAHELFYVRWWRRLTTAGTRGHGSA